MKRPVVSAPKYKGYVGTNLSYGKFRLHAGLTQVCDLYTQTGENERTENFTLLNASASYQLLKPLRLWLRADNLLAQRYEYISGMPMPRTTFMAGIQLDF